MEGTITNMPARVEYDPLPSQTGVVVRGGGSAVGGARFGGLTPSNEPVPLGDHEAPDWAELDKKTPKDYIRVATNEKTGAVMYRFVPISFVIKRLNKVFHHQWGLEIVHEQWDEPLGNGNVNYTCVVQLTAPGMWRPTIGVGGSTLYSNNPQESKAKTRNGALTAALKSAAKNLGIGRDIEEDDPEVAKVVNDRMTSINMLYERLVERGKSDDAQAVIRKLEPSALMENGRLMGAMIAFENLEPIQRELTRLAASRPATTTTAKGE